jgi:uncharacterized protein
MTTRTADNALDAARDGRVEDLRQLLAAGADVNAIDARGKTALMVASCRGHTEIVTALIAAGAEVNARDSDSNTALIYAAYFSQLAPTSRWVAIVQALIAAGADPNVEGGFKRMSALAWAKELKRTDLAALMGSGR